MSQSTASARCFKSAPVQAENIQLYVFSDASENGYGTAVYLRQKFAHGIELSFVMAKSKIAPKKPLTIPRLELNGALVAHRLVETLNRELTINIDETIYWTMFSSPIGLTRS